MNQTKRLFLPFVLLIAMASSACGSEPVPATGPAEAAFRERAERALAAHKGPVDRAFAPLVTEVWAFDEETFPALLRWQASTARQLLEGGEIGPGELHALANAIDEATGRWKRVRPIAKEVLERTSGYTNDLYARGDRASETLRGLQPSLRALAGGKPPTLETDEIREAAAPYLPDAVAGRHAQLRADTENPQRLRLSRTNAFPGAVSFLSPEPEVRARLADAGLLHEEDLLGFLKRFFAASHGPDGRTAIQPYIETRYYEDQQPAPDPKYAGWSVETLGPYLVVGELGDDRIEVILPGLTLTNPRGDLWLDPRTLTMDRRDASAGGQPYEITWLGGRESIRRIPMDAAGVFQRKLHLYEYQSRIERLRLQAVERAAETESPPGDPD